MNHGKKLAIVTAYDIYLECTEGKVDPEWAVAKPVGFHRFREKLGIQMLAYKPGACKYSGDERLRAATKLPLKRRHQNGTTRSVGTTSSGVSSDFLQKESDNGRLCGFLGQLNDHIASVKSLPNNRKRNCAVCGEKAYQQCTLCDIALHYSNPPKNNNIKVPCFFLYHDTGFCGLARDDCAQVGSPKLSWKMADENSLSNHSKAIRSLKKRMISDNNSNSTMANSSSGNNHDDDNWNEDCI